jgi:hypothetical protein
MASMLRMSMFISAKDVMAFKKKTKTPFKPPCFDVTLVGWAL